MYTKWRACLSLISLCLGAFGPWGGPAKAQQTEMERLQQCDRDLCAMLRAPSSSGPGLQCDLSKTFYKEQIDKALRAKRLGWIFGDAHCTVQLDVSRSVVSKAMTEDSYTLKVPEQPAACDVEYNGARYPVKVTMAPEITFRDGRATAVSLGVRDIEANAVIKAVLWSATKVQQSLGLYQDDLVRGVNRYVERQCRARPGSRRQVRLD
jgi:hypothetical protein